MGIWFWVFMVCFSLVFTALLFLKDSNLDLTIRDNFKHSYLTIDVKGDPTEVHYRLVGADSDKPLLLLIHGLGSSLASWRHLIPQLADDFRVLAIDLPGFGLSPDVKRRFGADVELIDELVINVLKALHVEGPLTLIGHSMGSVVSVSLMEKHPELFSHAVLINPALTSNLAWLPIDQAQWLAGPVSRVMKKDFIRMLYHRTLANPQRLEPEILDFTSAQYVGNAEAMRAFARYVGLIKRQSQRKIDATRSLFIFSEGDRVVTGRHRKVIQSLYPNAHFVSHPSGGHQLQEDEPEWLKDQIRHFLNSQKG